MQAKAKLAFNADKDIINLLENGQHSGIKEVRDN